jgi:hypothetical protein
MQVQNSVQDFFHSEMFVASLMIILSNYHSQNFSEDTFSILVYFLIKDIFFNERFYFHKKNIDHAMFKESRSFETLR